MQRAVLKYAVGDKPAVFDKNASEWLIRFGLVAIASERENEDYLRGSLDEPIIVEAGLNYSAIDERLRDNLQNQESGGQGHAFRVAGLQRIDHTQDFFEVAPNVDGIGHGQA